MNDQREVSCTSVPFCSSFESLGHGFKAQVQVLLLKHLHKVRHNPTKDFERLVFGLRPPFALASQDLPALRTQQELGHTSKFPGEAVIRAIDGRDDLVGGGFLEEGRFIECRWKMDRVYVNGLAFGEGYGW